MTIFDPSRPVNELPDADAIRAAVDAVLHEELYWFPVRHHSPTVARFVERAIAARKPKVVFLEAPAETQALAQFVVHKGTRPPVALYSSFRGETTDDEEESQPQYAAWYPLVPYSPEYVTMQAAKKVGAEVVFIDLPHWVRPTPPVSEEEPEEEEVQEVEDHFEASSFYRNLAKAAGYRTWDEAWDTLFELSGEDVDVETYRSELATFCAAVRVTTSPERIQNDDTLPRERHMWRTIQKTLADKKIPPSKAMVVCGGFHLFLDRNDETPLPEMPKGDVHVSLVPYSYVRIWERTGYGAGNRAPRFYQSWWEGARRGESPQEILATHAVGILAAARRKGERLAAADSIAVVHHTSLLAQLRGRRQPVLDDLVDALVTCCVKGDPATEGATLKEVVKNAGVGTSIGKVTKDAGRLPIVDDYYAKMEQLGFNEVLEHEKVVPVKLDLREPMDADKSAFLHRLHYLGVPIGEVRTQAEAFGQTVFGERWTLGWTPRIEDRLVERSLEGDTIELAALTVLAARLGDAANDAGKATHELVEAVKMDLQQMVTHAEAACGKAIDEDSRFISLATALRQLLVLERYASYRHLDKRELASLIERAYDRACFAVPEIAFAPEEQHAEVISGLSTLAELVLQREDLDADLFAVNVEQAAIASTVPQLRGAFLGILVEIRRLPAERIAHELTGYSQSAPDVQVTAGDFLWGVLSVSKTAVMLGARELVEALDEVLRAADREVFLAMVPRLRAAVEQLHKRHRDALAREIARYYGLEEESMVDQSLSTSTEAAALIAELDSEVARIMTDWLGDDA